MFILHVPFLPVDGMAMFPFILVRKPNPEPILVNHERIHLRQQLELLLLPFYIWYLTEYVIRRFQYQDHYQAYRNISFEREAFAHDADLPYLKNRRWWAFRHWL